MSAAHHKLDKLICLVDVNNQQADAPSTQVLNFEPLADKWAAFGWHVQRVNGNDLASVLQAFDAARALTDARPRVILFDTKMCCGIPFLEQREKNHFVRVEADEWDKAIAILDANRPAAAQAGFARRRHRGPAPGAAIEFSGRPAADCRATAARMPVHPAPR